MTPSLESVRWKIDRAKHHFNELGTVLNTWGAKEADNPVLTKLNSDWKTFDIPPESTEDFQCACALVAGDIVHNLRSALDHLVLQLALLNKTPVEQVSGVTSFPVCTSGSDFRSSVKSFKQFISGGALAALKRCQPYIAAQSQGKPVNASNLVLISKLDNIDKHRMLVVIKRGYSITDVTVTANDGWIFKPPVAPNTWMAVEDRAELTGVDLSSIDLKDEMHMDVRATFEVFINEPGLGTDALPLRTCLRNCIMYVDLLLSEFGSEFFGE